MRILLDTHAFLWYVLDDPQLSAVARNVISDDENDVLISPASYWEIAIKISIGKYSLTVAYESFWRNGIQDNDFDILPIEIRHTAALLAMPPHHKDPFDRLLIAQASVENVAIISNDGLLDKYGINRVW